MPAQGQSLRPEVMYLRQDEVTSVVWGMPGQVTNAGLCSAVLPLPEIATKLARLFAGERP